MILTNSEIQVYGSDVPLVKSEYEVPDDDLQVVDDWFVSRKTG